MRRGVARTAADSRLGGVIRRPRMVRVNALVAGAQESTTQPVTANAARPSQREVAVSILRVDFRGGTTNISIASASPKTAAR